MHHIPVNGVGSMNPTGEWWTPPSPKRPKLIDFENICLLYKRRKQNKMYQNCIINGGSLVGAHISKTHNSFLQQINDRTTLRRLNHNTNLNSGQMIHEWKNKTVILYSGFWVVVFPKKVGLIAPICQKKSAIQI